MDNTGRKARRAAKHGDNPVGAIMTAARKGGDVQIVSDAISAALNGMHVHDQRLILQRVSDSILKNSKAEEAKRAKPPGNTKAFEIHGPTIGKVTPEEFMSIVFKAVDDALNGVDNDLVTYSRQPNYSNNYNRNPMSQKELRKHLDEVFGDYTGSFRIGCSSPIRVYAMHELPSDEIRKKRRAQRELAKAQDALAKRREALERATKKEKELKAQLEKLAKDEQRYKKNLEKAEKEFENLKTNVGK